MFEVVPTAPPDAILGLTEAFHQDERSDKVNLTVGVYQDEQGRCPVLDVVRRAEQQLWQDEGTKTYLGIGGLPEFAQLVPELILAGSEVDWAGRVVAVQTPGGTAAVRVAADFVSRNFPTATAWCSQPTWANHPNIFQAAGLTVENYGYLDAAGTGLDRDAFLSSLRQIPAGDVVCLHACCHNPTGVDPDAATWQEVASISRDQGWLPLVDFAYQGFGQGLLEDAVSVRTMLEAGNELFVASSYSKNFGLYGERVGALTLIAHEPQAAVAGLSQLKSCIRSNYSNPPKHGAALVATILSDPQLRGQWQNELAGMHDRIRQLRGQFVDKLNSRGVTKDFSFIGKQSGMFSFSGLNRLQVDRLRTEFAVYIVGSGRINIAGLNQANLSQVCDAIAAVLADD